MSNATAAQIAQLNAALAEAGPGELVEVPSFFPLEQLRPGIPGVSASPGMLAAAEQALEFERDRANREREHNNALREFRRNPSGDTFIRLFDTGPVNEGRMLFNFIVETLRPAGLSRDGPFVWCSPEPDFDEPHPDEKIA